MNQLPQSLYDSEDQLKNVYMKYIKYMGGLSIRDDIVCIYVFRHDWDHAFVHDWDHALNDQNNISRCILYTFVLTIKKKIHYN